MPGHWIVYIENDREGEREVPRETQNTVQLVEFLIDVCM